MHQTVNVYQFRDAFRNMGRGNNFSYEALGILFEYLEEYEEPTGSPVELDVVALCCDFNEMAWRDVAEYYSVDLSACEDDEERIDAVREYLGDNTLLCGEFEYDDNEDGQEFPKGTTFVFQSF